jgi:hypothetical protein
MSDTVSGAAGKAFVSETNERCSEQRGGQDVGKRKKRVIRRAILRACCGREKETSNTLSDTASKTMAGERSK